MEQGLRELGAALLAGLVVVVVADFIFLNASTGKWFAPSLGAAPAAPATNATGGLPPAGGGAAASAPSAVTC